MNENIILPDTYVIIPCYNEAAYIGRTVRSVLSTLSEVKVLVVDDCSTDDSLSEAQRAGAEVHLLNKHSSMSKALSEGISLLPHNCRYVVLLDAADCESAKETAKLLKPLKAGRAEMAISIASGRYVRIRNRLAIFLARWGIWSLTKRKMKAPFSWERALTREVIEMIGSKLEDGNGFHVALTIDALRSGFSVIEVPTGLGENQESRISPKNNLWQWAELLTVTGVIVARAYSVLRALVKEIRIKRLSSARLLVYDLTFRWGQIWFTILALVFVGFNDGRLVRAVLIAVTWTIIISILRLFYVAKDPSKTTRTNRMMLTFADMVASLIIAVSSSGSSNVLFAYLAAPSFFAAIVFPRQRSRALAVCVTSTSIYSLVILLSKQGSMFPNSILLLQVFFIIILSMLFATTAVAVRGHDLLYKTFTPTFRAEPSLKGHFDPMDDGGEAYMRAFNNLSVHSVMERDILSAATVQASYIAGLNVICSKLGYARALIKLVDLQHNRLIDLAFSGDANNWSSNTASSLGLDQSFKISGILANVLERKQPEIIKIDDRRLTADTMLRTFMQKLNSDEFVVVPMYYEGQSVGLLLADRKWDIDDERKNSFGIHISEFEAKRLANVCRQMVLLLKNAMLLRENEAQRIYYILHDRVLQRLVLALKALSETNKGSWPILIKEKMPNLINVVIEEIRRAPRLASTGDSSKRNLRLTVEKCVDTIRVLPIRLSLKIQGTEPLVSGVITDDVERALMCFLGNVAQHSGADKTDVYIHFDKAEIEVKVIDNGNGFDEETIIKKGLAILQERLALYGGSVSLKNIESGCCATARIKCR